MGSSVDSWGRPYAPPGSAASAPGLGSPPASHICAGTDWSAHFRPHLGLTPGRRPQCARRYVRAADAAVVAVDVRGAQLLSLLQALLNAPPHGLQVGGRIRANHVKGKGLLGIRVWVIGIRVWVIGIRV
jgi:hypothetical protein